MKNRILNRLEYAGLEYLFQNIIATYETEYKGIIPCDISPVSQIIKRTGYGIQVADGCYNLYQIENFCNPGVFPNRKYLCHGRILYGWFHRRILQSCQ